MFSSSPMASDEGDDDSSIDRPIDATAVKKLNLNLLYITKFYITFLFPGLSP